ncbi:MAG: RNA polymerase sigma factor [Raineya sp.]|nr:RNA polymerase sigma factor [Raineya sp.]
MEKEKTFFSENELVSQLQNKNTKAFEYLYDNYAPTIYGVVVRIVGSEEIAQDVVQEAFVKVWSSMAQYSTEKGKLFTWVLNIARNTAIDKLRSKEIKQIQKNDSLNLKAHKRTDDTTQQMSEYIGFKEIMDKMKDEHKIIIELMYFEGYSQSEIAEKLSIPLGTVKTRARNALEHLRNLLKSDWNF